MSSILVGDVLERTTVLYGDHTALIDGETRYTYREASERVRRLAAGLLKLGLQPRSHIGVLANNSHRYWETYFAAHYAGMPLAPLNTRLSARELEFVMKDAEIRALIAGVEYLEILEQFRRDLPDLEHLIVLADQAPGTMHSYESILDSAEPLPAAARDWRESDMINLCYTGGTTARPKGVMLSQRNVISNAQHCLMNFSCAETDRWLHAAPMFHLADAWACYVFTMVGARHVFIPGFQPELFMETVLRERVTATILVPTMLNFLVNHPKVRDYDLSSLRMMLFGASPISTDRILAAKEVFGPILIQAYGMTETSPLLTSQKLEWLDYESAEGLRRLASCGREVVGVRIRVVNPDDGEAGPDCVGEVAARGPNVMLGYWRRPMETDEALRGGWMHTGDIGRMDGDGFLYIIDRAKDMIISGGENIYSTEVESALYEHPAVLEAAVIGIPDERWGEAVHAVVVLRDGVGATEDELIQHCHSLIAGYKCPKSVSFSEQALPKSGPGKILKTQLREPHWRGRERRVN
jgi:long-chain acyl-CoA synthetase